MRSIPPKCEPGSANTMLGETSQIQIGQILFLSTLEISRGYFALHGFYYAISRHYFSSLLELGIKWHSKMGAIRGWGEE